jgi:DNA helicase IV
LSNSEIEREQEYVGMLYRRVDELREQASRRLAEVLREHGGTRQALLEREASVSRYADRVARLDAAENGLCFGRLDLLDGRRHYIGRIGILDDSGGDDEDRDPLLLDWRAPAARAFYVATAAAPRAYGGAGTSRCADAASSTSTTSCSTATPPPGRRASSARPRCSPP